MQGGRRDGGFSSGAGVDNEADLKRGRALNSEHGALEGQRMLQYAVGENMYLNPY